MIYLQDLGICRFGVEVRRLQDWQQYHPLARGNLPGNRLRFCQQMMEMPAKLMRARPRTEVRGYRLPWLRHYRLRGFMRQKRAAAERRHQKIAEGERQLRLFRQVGHSEKKHLQRQAGSLRI